MVIRNRDSVVVLNEQNKGIAFQSSWACNIDDCMSEVQSVANKHSSNYIAMLSTTPSYWGNYWPVVFHFLSGRSPKILENDSEAEELMKFYFKNHQYSLNDSQIIKAQ